MIIGNKDSNIKVSISCITYNHEPYIRQCLEGFIMQKTTFAYEVLIHDDASTDATAEIIREYEEKYPDIIKPVYETENQWVKGKRGSVEFNFPRAKGKYIALCEGDDYWIDPYKLQKQVDIMDLHGEYSICGHDYRVVDAVSRILQNGIGLVEREINIDDFVKKGSLFFQPLTVLFRKSMFCSEEYSEYAHSKDITLFYHLLKKGKAYIMPDVMGCYRVHDGGIYSSIPYSDKLLQDLNTKLAISIIEKDKRSADYLCAIVAEIICSLGFSFIIKHIKLFLQAGFYMSPYYGHWYIGKLLWRKLTIRECIN